MNFNFCQVVTTSSPACTMSALFNIIILQAWRCPCPSPAKNLLFQWGLEQTRPARPNGLRVIPQRTRGASVSERGTLLAGGAQGRRRGASYFGGGASTWALYISKTKLEDSILKSESLLSWCSRLFCLYMCQFLIRPVWRKISIYK